MDKNNEMGSSKSSALPQRGPVGRGGGGGEKAKNFGKTWGKLISYMKKYMPAIIVSMILAMVGTIFNIVGPNQISKITDLITVGMSSVIDLSAIGKIAIVLVVLYALGFIFNFTQSVIMATIAEKVSKKMRKDISRKINNLPLRYFDSVSFGDVLSRVTNDVDTIGQTLNQSGSSLVNSITMLLGSLIMMFSINWIMAASAVIAALLGFGLMMIIMKKSQKFFSAQQKELGEMNGHIEETYAGHHVVKVYNAEKEAQKVMENINNSLYNSAWKSQFLSGIMQPLMGFIGNLGYVIVCIVGSMLVVNGSITFGVIVAFIFYIRMFTQPLSSLAQVATSMQSAAAASERVFEFLDEAELADESQKTQVLKDVKGDIDFQNVSFGYSKDRKIINNFSASIKAGQKIAIVGPTGAGKTTIVNLLMRFYEIDSGDIKIDCVSCQSLTRENVHDMFCMVLQDTWMFEGSVKENIVYNKQDVSDEDVVAACKVAGVDHFIRTLPKGYDTILNENSNLSAGQTQLITIARAMIQDAPMLILDEATSSVDTRTEVLIQAAMDKLMAGRTSFVIAHRLSTIKNADLILAMKDGDIVESGSHDELIAKNGFYAELYNSQFDEAA